MNSKAYVGQMWCVRSEARPSESHPIERQAWVTSTKYREEVPKKGPWHVVMPSQPNGF